MTSCGDRYKCSEWSSGPIDAIVRKSDLQQCFIDGLFEIVLRGVGPVLVLAQSHLPNQALEPSNAHGDLVALGDSTAGVRSAGCRHVVQLQQSSLLFRRRRAKGLSAENNCLVVAVVWREAFRSRHRTFLSYFCGLFPTFRIVSFESRTVFSPQHLHA